MRRLLRRLSPAFLWSRFLDWIVSPYSYHGFGTTKPRRR